MDDKMELDIIAEVINIGIGDAAASLSELVKTRVIITTPQIKILDVGAVSAYIQEDMKSLGVYIAQDFEGLVKGKTLLYYTHECALALLNRIFPESALTSSLSASAMATLQEIGNIVMVSCISTIADMMEGTLKFSMPAASLEVSNIYFQNLLKDMEKLDKAIVVKNVMVVAEDEQENTEHPIEGYFIILLSFDDFQELIRKLQHKNSA